MTTVADRGLIAPFRGLSPYGDSELDAMLFFGRERDTEIVVANLLAARLTVLYGPSGVGKTSLLRAGVAHRLRELAVRRAIGRGPDGAVIVFSSWAGDPVPALAAAVADEVRAVTGAKGAGPASSSSLADAVDHWSTVLDGELFIVLDQLEEHFVYHEDESGPGTLLGELPEVIVRPRLRAHVLLSLRDDALAQLDVFKGPVPSLFANVVRLDRLDHAAATAAILGPVQRFNDLAPPDARVEVEQELVDAVLTQAGTADDPGRVEPPYLQLVMERVWNEELERGSRELRASTLAELGGAREIVREHLDRALSVLDEEEQDVAARMFEHLVTPSGTKIAHRAGDLAQFAKAPAEEVDPLLATLGHERILRSLDEGAGGNVRYEIFHDVLAGAILGWRRRREVEHERLETRRHQRRLVAVVITAVALLLVMAAITVFALTQRSTARAQERSAEARALAAAALTELPRDPELSLLLARRAAVVNGSPLVENVLRESLLASRVRRIVQLGAPGVAAVFRPGDQTAVGLTATGRVVVARRDSGRVVREFETASPRGLLDPTGEHVLAFGRGRPPRLYTVSSGQFVRLRTRPVTDAAFSPSGRTLVTMDSGRLLRVWETATGALVRRFKTATPARVAAISPDDTIVVAGGGSPGPLESFSIRTGARLASLTEQSRVTHLAFGPSRSFLAVAGADKTAALQSATTGRRLAVFAGHVGAITGIAVNPQGTLIATSSTDGTARVWNAAGGLVAVLVGHGLNVTSVAFSPDGARAVTTSKDGTARVWHAEDGEEIAVLAGHGEPVKSAVFSADGRSVVTTGADGTMRLWYAVAQPTLSLVRDMGRPVTAARPAGAVVVVAPRGSPDVSVSADGARFAVSNGARIIVRSTSSGANIASFATPTRVTGVALTPDGASVAAGGTDGAARIYRLDGSLTRTLRGGTAPLTRLAFDPGGKLLAAGSTDGMGRVWNVATGALTELRGHTDTVDSARFGPDGSQVVTASRDHDARIWDVATGRTLRVLRAHFGEVSDAAFSPDGRWIATAGPGKAGLFDASTGELVFYLQGHEGKLTSASFAPDGRTIVSSGVDGTVRSYRCDVCVGLTDLERLADVRLAATHRVLTKAEERALVP